MLRAALLLLVAGLAVAPPALADGSKPATRPTSGAHRPAPRSHAAAVRRRPVLRGARSVKIHPDWANHPSTRYAAMDGATCRAELGRRGVEFTEVASAPGVLAPVRLPKDVGGVVFRTAAPANQRALGPYDVFDCRLVLALHDFSALLRAHDVDEVLLFSAWRPPPPRSPAVTGPLRRHPGGLAVDAYRFVKRAAAGQTERAALEVERDFSGTMGAPPCGEEAPPPVVDGPAARELRSIVCEAADQHLFTVILTPNYDVHHANHFHLEVTPDVPWYLVR
jgi:hypothetical protein